MSSTSAGRPTTSRRAVRSTWPWRRTPRPWSRRCSRLWRCRRSLRRLQRGRQDRFCKTETSAAATKTTDQKRDHNWTYHNLTYSAREYWRHYWYTEAATTVALVGTDIKENDLEPYDRVINEQSRPGPPQDRYRDRRTATLGDDGGRSGGRLRQHARHRQRTAVRPPPHRSQLVPRLSPGGGTRGQRTFRSRTRSSSRWRSPTCSSPCS